MKKKGVKPKDQQPKKRFLNKISNFTTLGFNNFIASIIKKGDR